MQANRSARFEDQDSDFCALRPKFNAGEWREVTPNFHFLKVRSCQMQEAKNTKRALVRIGFDGSVHKWYRATNAKERFENELRVLQYLERKACPFVPRILDYDVEELKIVTSNCGSRVEQMSDQKLKKIFAELETYGVRHDDAFLRNITYRTSDGRFCVIDFEFATILDSSPEIERRPLDSEEKVASPAPETASLFHWSGISDRGRFRPNNEDAFVSVAFNSADFYYLGNEGEACTADMDFVFAVSDGMGGERSGEFASRFTIDNITKLLPRRFRLSTSDRRSGIEACLQELFLGIHMQLTSLGRTYQHAHHMGATLSLIWYADSWLYYAHIGDGRIYHLAKEGEFQQLTEDHTYVGWLRRKGQLNEREARVHPRKNVLTQALGAGNQTITPQIGALRCMPGDTFVLCTDGVVDGLWDRRIRELICSPPKSASNLPPANRLVKTAVSESGRDNATAVVLEVG